MKTTIRVATPGDAAAVHLLIRGLAEYEGDNDAVEVTPDVLRDQMAWRQPPFECLLAERNGRPVGVALFYQYYSTWQGKTWHPSCRALCCRRGAPPRSWDCATSAPCGHSGPT